MEADTDQSHSADRPETYQFLFYDSEIRKIDVEGQVMGIHFSAANVVRRADEVVGYLSNVELQLWTEQLPNLDPACFGRLKDGHFFLIATRKREVELPFYGEGLIAISLSFSNGSELHCVGHKIQIQAQANAKFTESSNC